MLPTNAAYHDLSPRHGTVCAVCSRAMVISAGALRCGTCGLPHQENKAAAQAVVAATVAPAPQPEPPLRRLDMDEALKDDQPRRSRKGG